MAYYADPIGFLTNLLESHEAVSADVCQDPLFVLDGPTTVEVLNDSTRWHRDSAVAVRTDSATSRVAGGLLSMNGAEHRHHRRTMRRVLRSSSAVAMAHQAATSAARDLADSLSVGDTLHVVPTMRTISFRVVTEVCLGIADRQSLETVGTAMDEWIRCALRPEVRQATKQGGLPQELEALSIELESLVLNLFADSEAPYVLALDREVRTGTLVQQKRTGLLLTLLTAGWETTSAGLSWCLLLLSQHPGEALALQSELTKTHEDHSDHLERVLQETLRLCSPAQAVKRVATGDDALQGCPVPAGDEVICSQFVRHRDSHTFREPMRFDPGRWQHERPGYEDYFPFGFGWRRCVGDQFALATMRATIRELVRRFSMVAPPATTVSCEMRLALAPSSGLVLTVAPPGSWASGATIEGDWLRLCDPGRG